VSAFPPVNSEQHRISVSGGHTPRWRRDGRELFFLSSDSSMMSVGFSAAGKVSVAPPAPLFHAIPRLGTSEAVHDVSSDGRRFLLIDGENRGSGSESEIEMILNWPSLLRH
jgi:hypothetical protein